MSSLQELTVPYNGQEFLDIDTLLLALHDWAVKEKFSFRTEKREAGRASWTCLEDGCP